MSESLAAHNSVYREMLNGTVKDANGNEHPSNSSLDEYEATRLFQTVLKYKPMQAVEIGMAYGGSSLAICTALSLLNGNNQNLRTLTSIDPFQGRDWKNIGIHNLERSGLGVYHKLMEQSDYLALPTLLNEGKKFQFAYIDGWHTFDYTLVDFFYIDKMLDEGGIVAFNDCQLKAVQRVIRYVTSHRKYIEIDVEKDMLKRRGWQRIKRKAIEIRLGIVPDRYFQKQSNWEPEWNYYSNF